MSRSSNRVNFGTGGFVNPFEGLQSAIGDISKSYLQQEALEREEQRLSRAEAKDQARFDLQQSRLDTQEAWQRQKYDEDKARQEKLDLRQLDKDKMAETLFLQGQEDRKEEKLQKSIAKDILAKTNSHTAQSVASDMVDKAVLNTTLAGLQNTPGWTTSAMEGIVTNMQGIKDDTSTPDINERDEALKGLYLSAGGDPSKLNMDDIRYKAAGTVSKEDVLKPAMVEWSRQLANSGLTPERQDAVLKSLVTRFEAANSDLLGRDEQVKAKKAQAEQYKAVADSYRNDLQILNRSDGQVKVGEDGQLLYQGAKVSITEPTWDLDKAMKYGTTREATGDGIGGIITDTGGMNLQEDYNKALPILKDMLKNSGFTDAQASAAISKGLNQTVMNNYIDAKGRNYNDPEALTKAMYSNIMARKEVESNPEYLKNKELIDKGLQAGQAYRESLLAPTPTLNNLVAKLQGNMEVNMGSGRRAQTADNEFSRWEAEDRRFLEEGTKAAREQSKSGNSTTSSPETPPVGKEALATTTNEGRSALQTYLSDRAGASAEIRQQALKNAADIALAEGTSKEIVANLVGQGDIDNLLLRASRGGSSVLGSVPSKLVLAGKNVIDKALVTGSLVGQGLGMAYDTSFNEATIGQAVAKRALSSLDAYSNAEKSLQRLNAVGDKNAILAKYGLKLPEPTQAPSSSLFSNLQLKNPSPPLDMTVATKSLLNIKDPTARQEAFAIAKELKILDPNSPKAVLLQGQLTRLENQ